MGRAIFTPAEGPDAGAVADQAGRPSARAPENRETPFSRSRRFIPHPTHPEEIEYPNGFANCHDPNGAATPFGGSFRNHSRRVAHSPGIRQEAGSVEHMHTGKQYHAVMQGSRGAVAVRERFLEMVLDLTPQGASVLDFGAGTGIDAKVYAAKGHPTSVYEPSDAQREYLAEYCRHEIAASTITPVALPLTGKVHAVTANFAVFNHFEDHTTLFDDLSRVVEPGGFVLASLLNPYYLGDARYGWWRANILNLLRHGQYPIDSESRIHRFAPRVLARTAAPHFRMERVVPGGFGWAVQPYMFLLFRRH